MFFPNKARDTLRTTIPLLLTADKKERGFTPTWTRIRLPIIQKAKESNENRFEQERTEYHDDENTPTLVDSSNSFLEQLPLTASVVIPFWEYLRKWDNNTMNFNIWKRDNWLSNSLDNHRQPKLQLWDDHLAQ